MAAEPPQKIVETSPNPWQTYASQGQGKGKAITPESSTYGLGLVGITLLFVLLARLDRSNRRP